MYAEWTKVSNAMTCALDSAVVQTVSDSMTVVFVCRQKLIRYIDTDLYITSRGFFADLVSIGDAYARANCRKA